LNVMAMQTLEKQIAIRFSKEMYSDLEDLSEEKGASIADTVRNIIGDYFEFGPQKREYERKLEEKEAALKASQEFNTAFLRALDQFRSIPFDPRTHKIEVLPDGRIFYHLRDEVDIEATEAVKSE